MAWGQILGTSGVRGKSVQEYLFLNVHSLDIHMDTLIPITKHDEKKVSRILSLLLLS